MGFRIASQLIWIHMAFSNHPKPLVTPALVGVITVSLLSGCGDWPRYKNKPSISSNALSPGSDPVEGLNLEWSAPSTEAEPNDHPTDPVQLALKEGLIVDGVLAGLGWDSEKVIDRESSCGETLAFPPDGPGGYTGDVDWVAIEPAEDGVLCMQIMTDELDARLDAVLYTLDSCGDPTALFINPDTETPLGSDRRAGEFNWAISVEADRPLGVAIAGFWPDAADIELNWTIQLALVPSTAGDADALCPEPL